MQRAIRRVASARAGHARAWPAHNVRCASRVASVSGRAAWRRLPVTSPLASTAPAAALHGSACVASAEELIRSSRPMRSVAVVAHVDHGKSTLSDRLLSACGIDVLSDRMLDSMELEKERGITIAAKTARMTYKDHIINLSDTPGHGDFSGSVEWTLRQVDGVLLVVDAREGVQPQTKFVLSKAMEAGLPCVIVFNKCDREDHRLGEVEVEVLDLLIALGADDDALDPLMLYASARDGWCTDDADEAAAVASGDAAALARVKAAGVAPIMDAILEHMPAPALIAEADAPFQMLATAIDVDPYVGKLVAGKIFAGTVSVGDELHSMHQDGTAIAAEEGGTGRVTKLFLRQGMERVSVESAQAGDIVEVAGLAAPRPSDTLAAVGVDTPVQANPVDPPTLSVVFGVNDSPLSGKSGTFRTASQIAKRLAGEAERNVAVAIADAPAAPGLSEAKEVQGRGELQLAVLVEEMRREGFELAVGPPRVMVREDEATGDKMEPWEEVTCDVDEEHSSELMDKLQTKLQGELQSYEVQADKRVRIVFHAPTRALVGFQSEFRTDTRGTGVMNRIFDEWGPAAAGTKRRTKGDLVSSASGRITAYALRDLEARGTLFVKPGDETYVGHVIGLHSRGGDLDVNPVKAKQVTNMRASGTDEAIRLTPPKLFTLEEAIAYLQEDTILEVTPEALRIRKAVLDPNARRLQARNMRNAEK